MQTTGGTMNASQQSTVQLLQQLVTVKNAARILADAGKTKSAIRNDLFKADDRVNSRGEKIKGNGLAAYGAVIRRGRRVLIRLDRYVAWIAGDPLP
jgi:hypothetical protein